MQDDEKTTPSIAALPARVACQRFVNERARKDRDRLVPVRKLPCRRPAQIASGRSTQGQSGRPATHLKTVVRKDSWVRVPRPRLCGTVRDESGRNFVPETQEGRIESSR